MNVIRSILLSLFITAGCIGIIALGKFNQMLPLSKKAAHRPSGLLSKTRNKIAALRDRRLAPALGHLKPEPHEDAIINDSRLKSHEGMSLAIVRPFTYNQASALVSSFDDWSRYELSSSMCADYSVDLVLSFANSNDKSLFKNVYTAFEAIQSMHTRTNGWGGCIKSIDLSFADIPTGEDIYSDYYSEEGGNMMWVNGPNRQFERIFRYIESKDKYDVWYLMEPDSCPTVTYWLDNLTNEIIKSSPFAILGSKYDGRAWDEFAEVMPLELLHHINGNAVYNTTNPLMRSIVSELEAESGTVFNAIPYDLRIAQMILEGSTGNSSPFIFDSSIKLPDKTLKFANWWAKYASKYDPVKESRVITNQASMAFTASDLIGASIVHGKNMFLPWSDNDGTIALVIKASPSFDRDDLPLILGSNGIHHFSEIVIFSSDDLLHDIGLLESAANVPIKVQTRTTKSNANIICQAQVTSDWFMVIDDKFTIADDMLMMVASDGTGRPLQATTPIDTACLKSKVCLDTIAEARSIFPSMNLLVLSKDALFHSSLRDQFCNRNKLQMEVSDANQDTVTVTRNKMTSDSAVATSYFSFLYQIGVADSMYMMKSKAHLGIKDVIKQRSEVPRCIMENIVDVNFPQDEGSLDLPHTTPLFWHIPKSGGTTAKLILTKCLDLVAAAQTGAKVEKLRGIKGPDALRVVATKNGRFVNVNVNTEDGVREAAELDLIGSGLAEVVIAANIKSVAENLFSSRRGHTSKAFAIFRPPVERAVSLFYYLQRAEWEHTYDPSLKDMSIEEWAVSGKAENNWLVRMLLGDLDSNVITSDQFELAKEIIDRKVLVGLMSEMEESWDRFRTYFQWTHSTNENCDECMASLFKGGENANEHTLIEEGSKEWKAIAAINKWDIMLYDHILEVWQRQGTHMDRNHDAPGEYDHAYSTSSNYSHDTIESELQHVVATEYSQRMLQYPTSQKNPSVNVTVPGTITIEGSDTISCTTTGASAVVTDAIKAKACPANNQGTTCNVIIKAINGQSCTGGRMLATSRKLASSSIDFEVIIQALCSTTDCSDVQAIVKQFEEAVEEAVCTSVEQGTLDSAIMTNAASSAVVSLQNLVVGAGDISDVTFTLPPDLAAALASRKWYPDWEDSRVTCKNDGNEPTYMSLNPLWLYDSLGDCCEKYYSYSKNTCIVEGGGQKPTGTSEWYASWPDVACGKNCINSRDPECSGLATESDTLYPDAEKCCAGKFSWMDSDLCIKRSTTSGAVGTSQLNYCAKPSSTLPSSGTNKWYAKSTHCAKDCGSSVTDPECAEITDTDLSVKLYDTALECCQNKFSWLTSELCVGKSEQTFTNKFYVNPDYSKCLKDCDIATPGCGGSPEDLGVALFDTAQACCGAKLSWIKPLSLCVNEANGVTSPAVGSGDWYVDWILHKCVKDCPKGSSDSMCGGLVEGSWVVTHGTFTACCSTISWVASDECTPN